VLEERPIPELKDGEILVKTEYFSVSAFLWLADVGLRIGSEANRVRQTLRTTLPSEVSLELLPTLGFQELTPSRW
jgi:hypothetical protein